MSTSRASRVGFGVGDFGHFRFGWGDYAEIVLWHYVPEIYRTTDADRPDQEFRKWTDALKIPLQDLRQKLETFPLLRSPDDIQAELLEFLANDVGYVDDEGRIDEKRRSAILGAFLLYLNKGTEKGYTIIGRLYNVDVLAIPQWESPCGSGVLSTTGQTQFQPLYDQIPADIFENFFDDFFTVGGEIVLGLRMNSSTEPELISIDGVRNITDGLDLVAGVDYISDIVGGTVTLAAAAVAGKQLRVRQSVNVNCDIIESDEYSLWPIPMEAGPEDVCRTAILDLELTRIEGAESEIPASLNETMGKIVQYRPIHVAFNKIKISAVIPVDAGMTVELE